MPAVDRIAWTGIVMTGVVVMKTFSIAGGLMGPPSAAACADNRIDVVAAGPGNMVWRWSWDGTSWSVPAPLPSIGAIPAEGVCAVSSGPGRVEVFAAESGSRSPVWWRGNGTQWLPGPIPVLPPGANLPAEAVAAVCSSPDNIDVFAAGAGNTPWWWHWNGTGWTPPNPLPGGANLPPERIAAVSPAPGRLDVFAAGARNHLWHWLKVGTTPWRVEELAGDLPAEGVSAVSWGPNRIDVFAASRAPGNPLQHWWSTGAGFSGPESLGGNLAAGSVSAVSHAADRLDVFGITGGQRLAHWQWDGTRWTGPNLRGDNLPAGDVSAVVRKAHRLDVFVTGAGNQLRQWPGGGLENASTQPWLNWPTNRETNPVVGHLRPDSREELVRIVRDVAAGGRGMRAVGSSWSNSDAAVPPAYVVDTDRLDGVLTDVLSTSLNARGSAMKLVHVEAGIKLQALNELLDSRQLALSTMGGSSGQSLAGVLSTSAHGMDIDRGPIPDMVRAIHLVGPGGAEHWIEPSTGITDRQRVATILGLDPGNVHYDDAWFNSVLVSVGSMGIIYALVVEVVPQHDLVSTTSVVDWAAIKPMLKGGPGDPFPGNRGVQVVINPYPLGDGSRPCYLTTRTEAAATGPAPGSGLPAWLVGSISATLLVTLKAIRGQIDDDVTALTAQQQPVGTTRGFAHTIMGGPDPGQVRGLTVEVVFDATNARYLDFVDAALEILRKAYFEEPGSLGYLGWISMRFQGQSRAYLSPQHASSRSCTIEFAAAWRMLGVIGADWPDTPVLLARIEAKAREFGGIQHWGMNDQLDVTDVVRAYPSLDVWRRVRWELTRGGTITTFDSAFTRRSGLSALPPLPSAADYGKDGRSDFAIWRPTNGTWMLKDGSTGKTVKRKWGQAGDIPVPGRYDKDGTTDLAVWRPSDGTWYVIDSSTGKSRKQQWGQAGDVPVPGDYDGDGKTDFAVWRPTDGTWYVIDSSTGKARSQQWGQAGDVPVPGRYDSDARTDFAVWRPSDGTWYVIDSSTGKIRTQQWGQAGDIPVPADYDGDGKTDFAVWRPSDGTWYVIDSSTGKTRTQQWGQAGDIPVPGRYDRDKKTDFAIWRPSTGTWWVVNGSTGTTAKKQWGRIGDYPV